MPSTVALIDYGSGNLRSAEKALARAAAERGSGHAIVVTADPRIAATAERIVLPGVGAFADCMSGLAALPGMVDALTDAVIKRGVPFLGICVGMQLMARVGREFGDHAGLGWIDGEVVRMTPGVAALKIPQIGWNELQLARRHPLFDGIADGAHAYFVHSFVFAAARDSDVIARTDYGGPVTAAIGRDNLTGVQFHPEKSQAMGLKLLGNFLGWRP
ncbi:MAG TPA: imidazole glycerol phosphate synthase subunit HisH [Rhizomicrobium sp.]|nr:imidazole glycerol phosphate synthase subunit HisH [Rhizomicrobium sp.]